MNKITTFAIAAFAIVSVSAVALAESPILEGDAAVKIETDVLSHTTETVVDTLEGTASTVETTTSETTTEVQDAEAEVNGDASIGVDATEETEAEVDADIDTHIQH